MPALVRRILIIALVVGVVGAAYAVTRGNGKSKKDEVTYESSPVTREDVRSFVSATGVIQPWKTVDIKSNVAGRIDRLYVDLGDVVKPGQPIMDIDPTDTRTAFEQAKADLEAAKARRIQAEENRNQQELQTRARIRSAEQALASAQARLAEAEANKQVQPALTEAQIAQANANLVTAQRAVDQTRETKQQLQEQLNQLENVTIPLNVETVQSNLEQSRANLLTMQSEYKRQRNLMGQGYVSKSDVEQAYSRLKTTEASVRTAQQRMQTLKTENDLTVRELRARIRAADSGIAEAQARVKQAEAALDLADEGKVEIKLRAHQVESARAAVEQAKAELRAAEAERKQIAVRQQEITAAKAQIVRGQAATNQAKTNLGYTRILAPGGGGVVITKQVEEGTVVPSSRGSIGSTNALLQIGDVSRLWIKCNVDETDIGQVRVGQKVTVKVDAYPSLLIDGKVIRIDPQAIIEQNVTLIPVTVEIAEPDPRFKPGMNATCEFIVDEVTNALTVPNEALKESEGVYRLQKMLNGKPVEPIEIEVGLAGQDRTEIRGGDLKEGDEVLTRTIEPETPQTNNPFGNPFGGPRRRGGGAGGGGGRGGGGRGGR